jgi:hypothetical protein
MRARRFAAWIAGAAAALLLGACSTADFAYRNAGLLYEQAPSFLLWSVDDYLDLTAAQKDLARGRLARALEWHRRSELPRYASFLSDLEQQVDAGLDERALRDDRDRLRAFYRAIAEHLLPDAADLFATMDDGQVNELARGLARADDKVLEEAPRLREKSLGRTLDHLEAWTGKLAPAQREMVKSRLRAQPNLTPQRVAEWRVRQGALVALLRQRPPRDAMVRALDALLFDEAAWRDPAYARAIEARDSAMIGMLADLARMLTPAQVVHIRSRIHALQADIAKARSTASS